MSLSSRRNIYEKTCRSVSDHNINPSFEHAHTLTAIRKRENGWLRNPQRTTLFERNARMVLRGELGEDSREAFIEEHSSLARRMFHLFSSFERRKRVCTDVRCLSITFSAFPFEGSHGDGLFITSRECFPRC